MNSTVKHTGVRTERRTDGHIDRQAARTSDRYTDEWTDKQEDVNYLLLEFLEYSLLSYRHYKVDYTCAASALTPASGKLAPVIVFFGKRFESLFGYKFVFSFYRCAFGTFSISFLKCYIYLKC